MKILLLFIIVSTSISLLASGRIQRTQPQAADGIIVGMALEPERIVVGSTNLIFTLTDDSGQPVNDAKLKVKGNMTHAGMAPILGEATSGENGHYIVPFEWTMRGDWTITVDITLPNGEESSREFPVRVSSQTEQ